ncbi:hypothetical protein PQI66_14430 [Corynebacterium sp. USCH3]|uniref:hypothetical protein n=1 Tax=Corynebacterium sp. USCH3 TaxID=3024840 RepID=UPI0030A51428
MNAAPSVHLDRPALLTKARRIRRAADDLEKDSKKALDALLEQAEADTKVNTKGNAPAPLYAETLDMMTTGIEAARERVRATAATAREDAAALEAAAQESAAAEAAGVRDLDATDAELPN